MSKADPQEELLKLAIGGLTLLGKGVYAVYKAFSGDSGSAKKARESFSNSRKRVSDDMDEFGKKYGPMIEEYKSIKSELSYKTDRELREIIKNNSSDIYQKAAIAILKERGIS